MTQAVMTQAVLTQYASQLGSGSGSGGTQHARGATMDAPANASDATARAALSALARWGRRFPRRPSPPPPRF